MEAYTMGPAPRDRHDGTGTAAQWDLHYGTGTVGPAHGTGTTGPAQLHNGTGTTGPAQRDRHSNRLIALRTVSWTPERSTGIDWTLWTLESGDAKEQSMEWK